MQIKSNTLVKFVVPAVVLAGLVITMKSCSTPESGSESTAQSGALAGLSSEELRALGVEGDTPEDTLRTLVARLNQVRDNQKTLESQNAQLLKDNEQLRRRGRMCPARSVKPWRECRKPTIRSSVNCRSSSAP